MKVKAVKKKPAPFDAEQVIATVNFKLLKVESPPRNIEVNYSRIARLTPVENPEPFLTHSLNGHRN